jgi:hypothetical protein
MGDPRPLTRGEVIDRLARIIRDSLDPSFRETPPPAWAEAAAAEIIAYHQPMLRDTILAAHLDAALSAARARVEALGALATMYRPVRADRDDPDALMTRLDIVCDEIEKVVAALEVKP